MSQKVNIKNHITTFKLSESNSGFNTRSSYVGSGKSGYVPLYAINLPDDHSYYNTVNQMSWYQENSTEGKAIKEKVKELNKLIPYSIVGSLAVMQPWNDKFGTKIVADIRSWIDSDVAYELNPQYLTSYSDLSDFMEVIDSQAPIRYRIGSNYYITHYGAMFHIAVDGVSRVLVDPVYVLVTKKKYVKAIRIKWLLGEKIPNNWIEMWVHPQLDVTNSKWKSLRKEYKASIKALLISKNIRIVEKSDIIETLFNTTEVPKFRSPKEYKAWLNSIANSYLSTVYRRSSENELISIL